MLDITWPYIMMWSSGGRKSKSRFANTVFNTNFCQIVFGFGLYLRFQNQIVLCEKLIEIFVFGFYLRIIHVFGFGFASPGFVLTSGVVKYSAYNLLICKPLEATLGSNLTPKAFSVSFRRTYYQG